MSLFSNFQFFKSPRLLLLALSCMLLLGATPATANNTATDAYKQEEVTPNRFDKEGWSKRIKGLDYTEKPKKPKEDDNNGGGNVDFPDIDAPDIDVPQGSFEMFSKVVLFGLVFLILGFVIFRTLSSGALTKNQKIKPMEFNIENIEENLHESDLDRFLREALAAQNYRMAVRIYFLAIMKELSIKGHIAWQKDKTNTHYLMEMRRHPEIKQFRNVTRIFDYAWYSDANFGANDYQQVEPDFKQLLTAVQK